MKKLLVLLALCGAASAASAADLDYTYLEGGFSQSSIGGFSGHGYTLDGSFGLPLGFEVDASRDRTSFDSGISYIGTVDLTRTRVHLGWHVGVAPGVDLLFRVGGTRVYFAQDFPTYAPSTQNGFDGSVGLRAGLPAGFELEGDLGYDTASFEYGPPMGHLSAGVGVGNDTEIYQILALRYHVTDQFLLGLQYSASHATQQTSTPSTWLLSARWNFF
jgi:hypothetical protein